MKPAHIVATVLPVLWVSAAFAGTPIVLYNGADATNPNKTLDQSPWGWTYGETADAASPAELAARSAAAGVTTLNTTELPASPVNTGIKSGYANLAQNLDETAGYKLSFSVALTSETAGNAGVHSDVNDRAGFSVIALSSDHQGVELAFWQNEIWAQASTFTGHAATTEHALVSTTSMSSYDLVIHGGTYAVSQNGTFLFGGATKAYPSPLNPYAFPNFIFMGDDTTSRSASVNIASVTLTALPEPASLTLLAVGAAALLRRRRA